MNYKAVQSIVSLLVISLLFSCHENPEPTPYTYTKIFTGNISKTWSMTFVEETANGEVVDRFPVDCTLDDEYTFHATSDRLYEYKSGNNKCYSDEPDVIEDSWSFNNANATLTIILPLFSYDQPIPFIVRKVDDNDLTLEIFFDEEGTGSYRFYFKLKNEK